MLVVVVDKLERILYHAHKWMKKHKDRLNPAVIPPPSVSSARYPGRKR